MWPFLSSLSLCRTTYAQLPIQHGVRVGHRFLVSTPEASMLELECIIGQACHNPQYTLSHYRDVLTLLREAIRPAPLRIYKGQLRAINGIHNSTIIKLPPDN